MLRTSSTRPVVNAGHFRVIQGIGLLVCVVWSAITLGLDYTLTLAAWNQMRATEYASARGEITHSELEVDDLGDSRSFHPKLSYRYTVAGRDYLNDRYNYDPTWWSDSHAHRIVAAHPLGKLVAVRYDPLNPADAVLNAGLDGDDLFKALYLMPLNAVMLGMWCAAAETVYRWVTRPPAGGARLGSMTAAYTCGCRAAIR